MPFSFSRSFQQFRSKVRLWAVVLLLGGAASSGGQVGAHGQAMESWSPNEGKDLLGTTAPEFVGLKWLNCEPLTMQGLRGKIILIRFWLIDCPLCSGSADALNQLYAKYRDRGLVVIGIHHPKSEYAKDEKKVLAGSAQLGFKFPIAQDNDWQTIKKFWLEDKRRSFTSASLLIDRTGQICWVHDGGTLPVSGDGSEAYRSLDATIARLTSQTKP